MPVHRFERMTWTEVEQLDRALTIPLLPVGAIEAHGPHLPLDTDVIIAIHIAVASERVLSSFALADRINSLKEELALREAQLRQGQRMERFEDGEHAGEQIDARRHHRRGVDQCRYRRGTFH